MRQQVAAEQQESIRLFENPWLERLSHAHPALPLLFWTPVIVWLLWQTAAQAALGAAAIVALALAALLTWTLVEYLLHRVLFHYPARSRIGQRLVFIFHGNHHADPKDKTRLVMPPAGAVLIMACLYLLFRALLPAAWLAPFCAFFICGYLVYDYIHYATHHFPMRNPVARYLKHYHLRHHFSGEPGRYGVSRPLWDIIFGTRPPELKRDGR